MSSTPFDDQDSAELKILRSFKVRLEVGRMAYEAGSYSQAARHFQLALDLAERDLLVPELVATALRGLAKSIAATGRFADAEKLIRRALDIDEGSGSAPAEEAEDYHQLSLLYWRSGHIVEAEEFAIRSWELANRDPDAPDELKAKLLKHFAVLCEQRGDLNECERYLNRALDLIEQSNELDKQSSIYGDILLVKVLLLAEQNRMGEARDLYPHAINLVEMNRGIAHPRVHEVLALFEQFESGNSDRVSPQLIKKAVREAQSKSKHGII